MSFAHTAQNAKIVHVLPSIVILLFAAILVVATAASATVKYSIDLTGGTFAPSPSPFISVQLPPTDSNGDGFFETVLKVNVGDPALANPFDTADFLVSYTGNPRGLSINIGDSVTNNGFKGDAGTQSNDAEFQIGANTRNNPSNAFLVYSNDNKNRLGEGRLLEVPDFVKVLSQALFTVSDQKILFDNGEGTAGSLISPFIFALAGQPDQTGPVNYDIFAAFNRTIGSGARLGAGVGRAQVCLRSSDDPACFTPVPIPVPGAIFLLAPGIGALLVLNQRRRSVNEARSNATS